MGDHLFQALREPDPGNQAEVETAALMLGTPDLLLHSVLRFSKLSSTKNCGSRCCVGTDGNAKVGARELTSRSTTSGFVAGRAMIQQNLVTQLVDGPRRRR